jgi:hypothetical protein
MEDERETRMACHDPTAHTGGRLYEAEADRSPRGRVDRLEFHPTPQLGRSLGRRVERKGSVSRETVACDLECSSDTTDKPRGPWTAQRGRRTCRDAGPYSVEERMKMICIVRTEEEWLVERCLHGDAAAWQDLFDLNNPPLLGIIRSSMGIGSSPEQAEEIAAAVWSSLCSQDYARLRRWYELGSGKLLYSLSALARREIWRWRRSERCRHFRECCVARKEATRDEIDRGLSIQEFLATLTGRERDFCLSELLRQTKPDVPSSASAANVWQLRSRVLKKFRNYFRPDNRA